MDLLQMLSQFGAAGLIGVMWIVERRHAAARDRNLVEAHRKLMAKDQALNATISVIRDNTRAIAALEHTQRQLIEIANRLEPWKPR
jgi:hypothetical protein